MRKSIFVLCILLLTGCNLLKKVNKKENDTSQVVQTTERTVRKGDTVTFVVPNIRYKDTTIYSVNRVGTRIETRYDNQGNIDLINCYSSEIDLLKTQVSLLQQSSSEKDKTESAKPNPWFWIAVIVCAGVVLVILKKI